MAERCACGYTAGNEQEMSRRGPELSQDSRRIETARPHPWGHENRRKSLLHKAIKNPAPNEGAGHSQGERRLLVIQKEKLNADSPKSQPGSFPPISLI